MPKISWPQLNRIIEVPAGTSILDGAVAFDIPLEHICGGCCACTTCHVAVADGHSSLSPMGSDERERLEDNGIDTEKHRLSCQTRVHGDVTLEIPELLPL